MEARGETGAVWVLWKEGGDTRRSFLLRRRPVVDAEATLALERGREEDPLGMAE